MTYNAKHAEADELFLPMVFDKELYAEKVSTLRGMRAFYNWGWRKLDDLAEQLQFRKPFGTSEKKLEEHDRWLTRTRNLESTLRKKVDDLYPKISVEERRCRMYMVVNDDVLMDTIFEKMVALLGTDEKAQSVVDVLERLSEKHD